MKKSNIKITSITDAVTPYEFAVGDELLGRVVGGMVAREGSNRTMMATLTLNSDADVAYDFGR